MNGVVVDSRISGILEAVEVPVDLNLVSKRSVSSEADCHTWELSIMGVFLVVAIAIILKCHSLQSVSTEFGPSSYPHTKE